MRITVGVATKNRYGVLSQCLLSLALQSTKDFDVIIVDDSDEPIDLRELQQFQSIFHLFNQFGIGWQVVYGKKLGQHYSHQQVQEMATTDFIYRLDDDEVAEPFVLEKLKRFTWHNVGAVGGLVLSPGAVKAPEGITNRISDLNTPNCQWFTYPNERIIEVDHLHSTFLYRRGIVDYELGLSPAAHREETILTYSLKRKDYKILVNTGAITWHLRASEGGIRSHPHPEYWEADEKLFQSKLQEWGVNGESCKMIVIDAGKGDHVIVEKLLPELREKYGKLIIASCYPDVFEGVEQISIAEARQRMGNIEGQNIYRKMIDWNWKGSVESAYRKLYGIERKTEISQ